MGVIWSLTLREKQRLRVSQNRMPYCLLLIKEDTWAHCPGNQIKKNEMGRACGMYGRQERCIQGFGGKT